MAATEGRRAAPAEGRRTPDGGWEPTNLDSPFRRLTATEVANLEQYARTVAPPFEGPHNATWEQHHPVAREIWAQRGVGPK